MTDSTAREYSITRLSKKNLGDLATLHAAVYGKAAGENYFTRKYDTAYTGMEYIGFIAYTTDQQPIAYYGVIPCFIRFGNQVITAAQSADTMTDPNHRYKGMFVELSNITFDLCRQLGIRLIFGFPNQHSYHGAVTKLGWKMTETMHCFTIPVRGLPIQSLSTRARLLKNIYSSYSRFILRRKLITIPGVANSVLVDGFGGVHRSDDYFAYKSYSPTKVIAIGEARIWINNKYGLVIGDMEGVNETNFTRVMSALKKMAGQLGAGQLQFHCSGDTRLGRLFLANYPSTPSYPVLFQDFGSTIPPGKIKFTFSDIDIF